MVKANLRNKGKVRGYPLSFCLKEASDKANKEEWMGFNSILACCIYVIILFPNEAKFVDLNVVSIFILRNHVPTLLGDLYHSLHSMSAKGKGGIVFCCAPLVYHWFKCHLPREGAFVETRQTLKWSQRLMGLRSKDLDWYRPGFGRLRNKEIIVRCGGFPNVPLMGIRGGINYNLTLARRQLGYALRTPPLDREIEESLVYNVPDDSGLMKKASKAWENVHLEGSTYFGKRDSGIYLPYV